MYWARKIASFIIHSTSYPPHCITEAYIQRKSLFNCRYNNRILRSSEVVLPKGDINHSTPLQASRRCRRRGCQRRSWKRLRTVSGEIQDIARARTNSKEVVVRESMNSYTTKHFNCTISYAPLSTFPFPFPDNPCFDTVLY